MMAVLVALRRRPRVWVLVKHLPGRHNQKDHGNRYHDKLHQLFSRAVTWDEFRSKDTSMLLEALGPTTDDRRVRWVVVSSVPPRLSAALHGIGIRPKQTRVVMTKGAVRHVLERHPGSLGAAYLPLLPVLLATPGLTVAQGKHGRALVHVPVSSKEALRIVLQVVEEAGSGEHTIRTCFVRDIRRI